MLESLFLLFFDDDDDDGIDDDDDDVILILSIAGKTGRKVSNCIKVSNTKNRMVKITPMRLEKESTDMIGLIFWVFVFVVG